MVDFKSLIVLDLETTGLPQYEHNRTKITELSLLGCEIEHIKNSSQWPRVLHKLVLCFNPEKMIQPKASEVSGLSNEMLEKVKPFTKEDVEVISHFISRLPSPICIVAHNGNAFDFPILRRQFEKLKMNLPKNVYCVDSVVAFQSIYPKENIKTTKNFGETTPKHQTTNPTNSLNYKNKNSNELIRIEVYNKKTVCKNLFGETPEKSFTHSATNLRPSSHKTFSESPKSYKLQDIYNFLHKYNFPNAHEAEVDCQALLSCIIKCQRFFSWMNENAVVFNAIEPLF